MIGIEMMAACAPNVAPATLQKIIQVESGGNRLAVNVNNKWVIVRNVVRDKQGQLGRVTIQDSQTRPQRKKVTFKMPIEIRTVQDAVTVTYSAIAAGFSVDMSYMQVNSNNLKALGYSVEEMFEPCKNLAAGARVLTAFYSNALPKYRNPQSALHAALSAYNTGDFRQGFANGYVARYGISSHSAAKNSPKKGTTHNPYTASPVVVFHGKEETMSRAAIAGSDVSFTEKWSNSSTAASGDRFVRWAAQEDN